DAQRFTAVRIVGTRCGVVDGYGLIVPWRSNGVARRNGLVDRIAAEWKAVEASNAVRIGLVRDPVDGEADTGMWVITRTVGSVFPRLRHPDCAELMPVRVGARDRAARGDCDVRLGRVRCILAAARGAGEALQHKVGR